MCKPQIRNSDITRILGVMNAVSALVFIFLAENETGKEKDVTNNHISFLSQNVSKTESKPGKHKNLHKFKTKLF